MEIISRTDAKTKGLKYYFTGKPCDRGHIYKRYVSNYCCCICQKMGREKWYERNRDRLIEEGPARRKAKEGQIRAYRAAHLEEKREHNKEYKEANKEQLKEYNRGYNRENSKELSTRHSAYNKKHRARIRVWARSYMSTYRVLYPEKIKSWANNRRARDVAAEGCHTGEDIRDMLTQQGNKCVYCLKDITEDFHADHIVALINGGSNFISNIQLLCPTCNFKKGRKDPQVFKREIEKERRNEGNKKV